MIGVDAGLAARVLQIAPNQGMSPREAVLSSTAVSPGSWATVVNISGEGWLLGLMVNTSIASYRQYSAWRVTIDQGAQQVIAPGLAIPGMVLVDASGDVTSLGGIIQLSPALHFHTGLLVELGHTRTGDVAMAGTALYAI